MRNRKVILDTNIWISFLISRNLNSLDKHLINRSITLIFSEELLQEFISVAKRPKFKKYFSDNDINELLRLFDIYGKFVNVVSEINGCRDKKDNFLLNLAIDSNADYLVTGDGDLLDIKKINNTEIIKINKFLEII
ncbi:MAG: putative toxin-antitoxin system toxin component, PIN family [Bacteroidales bacterium]|nr:putative toxin-antitoxin system toxin component, PIN family [Bacteroidales bacterium]